MRHENPSRQMPSNINAEMSVLGALLIGDPLTFDRADSMLTPESFYRVAHGTIYAAMVKLATAQQPIDLTTLRDELMRREQLDNVGGLPYLAQLADAVPTAASIVHYAKIVAEMALRRRIIQTASEVAGEAYDLETPVEELKALAEEKVLAVTTGGSEEDGGAMMRELIPDAWDRLDEKVQRGGAIAGVSTGIHELDNSISGLQKSHLVIAAGRPGMGKTGLAGALALTVARTGRPVLFFSLEMTKEQITDRLIAIEAEVGGRAIQTGQMDEAAWSRINDASARLMYLPLKIDDLVGIRVSQMVSRARKFKLEHGDLGLIVVDYLQIVGPRPSDVRADERIKIGNIADDLKTMSRALDVPVLALAQVNRGNERREDKRPTMSDLAESGKIEARADEIMFVYRPAYYAKNAVGTVNAFEPEEAEIIVAKSRHGMTGVVPVAFTPAMVKFDNPIAGPSQFVFSEKCCTIDRHNDRIADKE